jgi:hypothetical protein
MAINIDQLELAKSVSEIKDIIVSYCLKKILRINVFFEKKE